jgi:hypothetical protein
MTLPPLVGTCRVKSCRVSFDVSASAESVSPPATGHYAAPAAERICAESTDCGVPYLPADRAGLAPAMQGGGRARRRSGSSL